MSMPAGGLRWRVAPASDHGSSQLAPRSRRLGIVLLASVLAWLIHVLLAIFVLYALLVEIYEALSSPERTAPPAEEISVDSAAPWIALGTGVLLIWGILVFLSTILDLVALVMCGARIVTGRGSRPLAWAALIALLLGAVAPLACLGVRALAIIGHRGDLIGYEPVQIMWWLTWFVVLLVVPTARFAQSVIGMISTAQGEVLHA